MPKNKDAIEKSELTTQDIPEVKESENVGGESYSVVNTKISKEDLIKDGWVQQTKAPFLDVDGKSKLIFQKKSFYKFLEVSA